MANNYAVRLESERFSFPDIPCGTGHGYILRAIGVSYDGHRPTVLDEGSSAQYISGDVAISKAKGPDTGDFNRGIHTISSERPESSLGMYVRGEQFARPNGATETIDTPDIDIVGAIKRIVKGGEESSPETVTFLDRFALEHAKLALEDTPYASYEQLIKQAIDAVVTQLEKPHLVRIRPAQ